MTTKKEFNQAIKILKAKNNLNARYGKLATAIPFIPKLGWMVRLDDFVLFKGSFDDCITYVNERTSYKVERISKSGLTIYLV